MEMQSRSTRPRFWTVLQPSIVRIYKIAGIKYPRRRPSRAKVAVPDVDAAPEKPEPGAGGTPK